MNILEILLGLISSLLGGGIIGAFVEKRKRKAEAEIIEADVLGKIQEQYKIFIDTYEKQYKELQKENDELKSIVKDLKIINNDLSKRIEDLERVLAIKKKYKPRLK